MQNNKKIPSKILKEMHERVSIQEFLRDKKLFDGSEIIYPSSPHERPDAMVKLPGNKTLWIEESEIFKKFDKRLGPNHFEYRCPTNISNYQSELKSKVIARMNAKEHNDNYKPLTGQYGPGILLLTINDACFHWQRDLNAIIDPATYADIHLSNFSAVYLYYRRQIMLKSLNPIRWTAKAIPGPAFFLLYGSNIIKN